MADYAALLLATLIAFVVVAMEIRAGRRVARENERRNLAWREACRRAAAQGGPPPVPPNIIRRG